MDFKEKYDLMVHIVNESDLSTKDQLTGVAKLFPKFDQLQSHCHNDKYLTDYVIELYAYSRSLGMSVADSANSARISATLMKLMLDGVGLSIESFTKLAEAELYAASEMKRKHLSKLDQCADSDDGMKASIAFLEKIYPKQYGPRATVTYDVDDSIKQKWEIEVQHITHKDKEAIEIPLETSHAQDGD